MWVAIGAVAVAVLVAAAFAGLGKFGEMPAEAVHDRPKGLVPEGPITPDLLERLRLPTARTGYSPGQVDEYLAALVAGLRPPSEDVLFDVVRRGYDMQVLDALLARPVPFRAEPPVEEEASTDSDPGRDSAFTRPPLLPQPGADLLDAE